MVVNTENQQLRNHDPKRSQLDQEKHGLAQQVNEHQSTLSLGEPLLSYRGRSVTGLQLLERERVEW
jgi:hypothetical protein